MWRLLNYTLIALAIAVLIGTEFLRTLVHRRREYQTGIGGTQDVAMFGVVITVSLLILAAISGVLSHWWD